MHKKQKDEILTAPGQCSVFFHDVKIQGLCTCLADFYKPPQGLRLMLRPDNPGMIGCVRRYVSLPAWRARGLLFFSRGKLLHFGLQYTLVVGNLSKHVPEGFKKNLNFYYYFKKLRLTKAYASDYSMFYNLVRQSLQEKPECVKPPPPPPILKGWELVEVQQSNTLPLFTAVN